MNIADPEVTLEEHLETKAIDPKQKGFYEREQRYHMFIEKMMQLYRSERRLQKRRN